jgi:N-acetylglutamate synthase/N-acetylornithine aminotransferase
MEITIFEQLTLQIVSSKVFDSKDRASVKKITNSLALDSAETTNDINYHWKNQVELEATIIYLLGKYGDILQETENQLLELETELSLSMEKDSDGKKYKLETLLSANPTVQTVRRDRDVIKNLCRDLSGLSKVVFGRNQKLENLSIHYRREQLADERS